MQLYILHPNTNFFKLLNGGPLHPAQDSNPAIRGFSCLSWPVPTLPHGLLHMDMALCLLSLARTLHLWSQVDTQERTESGWQSRALKTWCCCVLRDPSTQVASVAPHGPRAGSGASGETDTIETQRPGHPAPSWADLKPHAPVYHSQDMEAT